MQVKKYIGIALIVLAALGGLFWWRGASVGENATAAVRTVQDDTGRTVSIPMQPQRVVILNASHLDLYCAAGGAAKVVGKPTSKALSDEVKGVTAGAQEVGVIHSPNVEAILALQPDLVIGINVPFHSALIPVLEKANIPMVIQSLNTYEEVLTTLKFYGELTGDAPQAAKAIGAVEKKYGQAAILRGDEKGPRTLIVWGTANSFSMATSASFAGDLLKRAGGENIADYADQEKIENGFVPLGMEYIAKADPKVIFLITHSAGEGTDIARQFTDDPVWKDIKAVREKRVYALPSALFAVNPGTRISEALEVLTSDLYAGGAT